MEFNTQNQKRKIILKKHIIYFVLLLCSCSSNNEIIDNSEIRYHFSGLTSPTNIIFDKNTNLASEQWIINDTLYFIFENNPNIEFPDATIYSELKSDNTLNIDYLGKDNSSNIYINNDKIKPPSVLRELELNKMVFEGDVSHLKCEISILTYETNEINELINVVGKLNINNSTSFNIEESFEIVLSNNKFELTNKGDIFLFRFYDKLSGSFITGFNWEIHEELLNKPKLELLNKTITNQFTQNILSSNSKLYFTCN